MASGGQFAGKLLSAIRIASVSAIRLAARYAYCPSEHSRGGNIYRRAMRMAADKTWVVPLHVVRIFFRVTFLDSGVVSRNWGPTIRGGFGSALRELACCYPGRPCGDCPVNASCPYGYVFETPVPPSASVMRRYPQAPHPFVFEPDQECPVHVRAGDTATHALVVIGEAVRHLPHLFSALRKLGDAGLGGDRVPFRIDRMFTEDGNSVFEFPEESRFESARPKEISVTPGPSRWDRFDLLLVTPTRITVDGRIAARPGVFDIAAALARRVFLLSCFHCGGPAEPHWDDFLDAARGVRCIDAEFQWIDAERFSTRQQQRIPIGGVVGKMTCQGDLGRLEPLLRAGEYVHVGKNAAFGLGKILLV